MSKESAGTIELYRRVAPITGSRETIGSALEISPKGFDELTETGFLKGEIKRRYQKEFVPLYVRVYVSRRSLLIPFREGSVARESECDSYLLSLDPSDFNRLQEAGWVLVNDHCLIKLSKNGR